MDTGRVLLPLAAIVMALGIVACGDSDKSFEASKYAGTYEGTWTNSATGASGPVTIAITIDEAARKASLTLDFDGNYLGLGDPPAATLEGTFDDERAIAKGESDLFGEYNVTIEADGEIIGVMENLAGGLVPRLTYTGELTADKLDADYTVSLKDGATVNSTLRMTKQK
ncbi:MAG: hypothetical protein IH609_05310 [Dehalococcoidia bacterium]|nr:hypothetical protein [Dehalococcoidia bacterium]